MLSLGGVATSICDCSISVITRSPSAAPADLRNFLFMRRAARRVLASNTKYSSSMPSVYMRALTRDRDAGSVGGNQGNSRRAQGRAAVISAIIGLSVFQQAGLPQR